MLATRDMIRAWPEFHHVVLYLQDTGEDYEVINSLSSDGADIRYVPTLTPQVVASIDPVVIFFNNTPGALVADEYSYRWLHLYTIVAIHHNPTFPLFDADLDIFVTEDVLAAYENCRARMKHVRVVPPCIDTREYLNIQHKRDGGIRIGKLSNDNPGKFSDDLIDIFETIHRSNPEVSFTIVGGKKYHTQPSFPVSMPAIGSKPVRDFYADFDILVYKTKPEVIDSWCRVVTEAMASGLPVVAENRGGPAKQIDHYKTGFLCECNEDFEDYLKILIKEENRRKIMGQMAREKAKEFYDINRLREATTDAVIAGLKGAA